MSLESCLSWAGRPETGLHLDVMKDNKLIQKIMIDENSHYIFGRNPDLGDLCLNHASCSRQHAALIYHKHLKRFFLMDLGSKYGTFINKIRIESNKPTQIQPDTQFSFGESTRYFILRERPVQLQIKKTDSLENEQETLPENEQELNNLTEFNTAHNKKLSALRVSDTEIVQRGFKRKKKSVNFRDEEDIINPYDVDDKIGKFTNLVQTTIIPNKRFKSDHSFASTSTNNQINRNSFDFKNNSYQSESLSLKSLNFNLPNSAPAVDFNFNDNKDKTNSFTSTNHQQLNEIQYKPTTGKKKYAKEVWPREKPF